MTVGDKPIERQGRAGSEIIMNEAKTVTVLRNGKQVVLTVPSGLITQLNRNRLQGLASVRIPIIVDSLLPNCKVLQGSLRPGDTLIGLEGHPLQFDTDLFRIPPSTT